MILSILYIVAGIAAVLWGADRFTDGAASVAQRFNVPQIVIGMTVVAFGTSLPEFCVSFASALKGAPDMALGNVVGSNIFNALLITGAAAAITPIAVGRGTVSKDMTWALVSAIALAGVCLDGEASRLDSGLLLVLFMVFMAYTLRVARQGSTEDRATVPLSITRSTIYVIVGLVALVIGSNVFVDGAADVARRLGVSEAIVGLTVVAAGTGFPELATSIVAARKGHSGLALGNVIGSNVFNSLMVIGLTGLVVPLQAAGITRVDFTVLVGSTLLLWAMSFTKYKIERWEGCVLMGIYAAYLGWLVCQTVCANTVI